MNYPTPYGKSDDLALENERLRGLVKELKGSQQDRVRDLVTDYKKLRESHDRYEAAFLDLQALIESGEVTDGFHTFSELYEARMLYHAWATRAWLFSGIGVVKSWNHSDGEPCFGGGWFIVVAYLPTGQTSQHYRADHWDLFKVPSVEYPLEYDGHTTQDTHQRLRDALETKRNV